MSKRDQTEAEKLSELEAELGVLIRRCLEECAQGRQGLFAQSPENAAWPEAERVRVLAQEIAAKYSTFGSVHPVCELFLHYCSLRHGGNRRGEPKMAAEFLEELKDLDGNK